MNCDKCGFLSNYNSKFCGNCGNPLNDNINLNGQQNNKKSFFRNKKKLIIVSCIIILFIIIATFIIIVNGTNKRKEELTNIDEVSYVKYKYGEDELYFGKEVSSYISKGYLYDTEHITKEDYIIGDSISIMTFYKDDEAKFLGALYCPKKDKCTYEESTLVKINFYNDKNLLIDDYLKYGLSYDDVVSKYGKEDGTFYQNEEQLVWTFGEKGKIGEPYYVLRFDEGGWFSTGKLIDIRIGVWWYDGEYEYSVIKNNSEGGIENEEK